MDYPRFWLRRRSTNPRFRSHIRRPLVVRRRDKSWSYDFKPPGQPRVRKAGFATNAAALAAGEAHYQALQQAQRETTFSEMYHAYRAATTLALRS